MKPFRKPKKLNTYAFIDSQNLNMGTQKAGWKMDWRKFRALLRDKYGVTKAYMFIGHMPEHEDLYSYMHELGFLVVLKPTLETTKQKPDKETSGSKDQTGPAPKGNVDADLVLWVMKEVNNYQKAIVVSGDGDFYGLYEHLAERGKLLHIMAPNWQYSSLLKPFEKYIVRIDQMRSQLAYHDRKKQHKY